MLNTKTIRAVANTDYNQNHLYLIIQIFM